MDANDVFTVGIEAPAEGVSKSPCGCGQSTELATDADLLASLDAALNELERGGDVGFEEGELDLAALDEALAEAEMLDPFAEFEEGGTGFEQVVSLLERYPGLKITFSF